MRENNLEIGAFTVVGDRPTQQDALGYRWNGPLMLATVCDGMGGMEGGEMASQTGVADILNRFANEAPESVEDSAEWMRQTFISADSKVAALAREDGTSMNAGSTCVMAVTDGSTVQWGSVGDSAIYFYRGGMLRTINRMHNYDLQLEQMVEQGQITEAERHAAGGRRDALISYLGIGGLPLIDTGSSPVALQPGDVMILCSDGVYKSLEEQQIQALIEECGGRMQVLAQRLCNEAWRLAPRKQDNTTAIAIRCTDGGGTT